MIKQLTFLFQYHSDIDECAENEDNCTDICINTIGGFNCSCSTGLELQQDGISCAGKTLT